MSKYGLVGCWLACSAVLIVGTWLFNQRHTLCEAIVVASFWFMLGYYAGRDNGYNYAAKRNVPQKPLINGCGSGQAELLTTDYCSLGSAWMLTLNICGNALRNRNFRSSVIS